MTSVNSPYDKDLDINAANYQALTPLSFLARSARIFPDATAIIHGKQQISYRDFYRSACRLASALERRGVGRGDTVSVMLANTPPMLICHYGVPMTGAILNTLNTRLDAAALAFILDHANTKVLLVDKEFSSVIAEVLTLCKVRPLVVDFDDKEYELEGRSIGSLSFEELLEEGCETYEGASPEDEWDAISLNYTSGTTGNPKGVVYHHRGAYLCALGNALTAEMPKRSVYLWTLPMFHCNGWCFPWTMVAVAGTQVCLRWVRANAIFQALSEHKVSHLCGAPIVMSIILGASDQEKRNFSQSVTFMTAAAPPPEAVLSAMKQEGFQVTHLYGLTETFGPAAVNEWKEAWNELSEAGQATKKARQGVPYLTQEDVSVRDPETMEAVPADGSTIGEVMFRGNLVMKGYLNNPKATEEAFTGGWFHSGDLGVMYADGYIQLKDRSKDIIISGGENISSIEVEDTIYKLSGVAAVAVVARPHEKWGESPCAFVEMKSGQELSEADIINHCREHMAHYKVPRSVFFETLPKTSTGKIQKFILRDKARSL